MQKFIVQIHEFVKLAGDQIVPYYADILGAILPCIADKEEKIRIVSFLFPCHLKSKSVVFFDFSTLSLLPVTQQVWLCNICLECC